jgi:(p)ppGpp synthase/HD superfamily hydrolase
MYNRYMRDVKDTRDAKGDVKTIEDLINKVRAYNSGADTEFLSRAYYFSSEAHGLQKRKEGTPYMAHPLAVASILADISRTPTLAPRTSGSDLATSWRSSWTALPS